MNNNKSNIVGRIHYIDIMRGLLMLLVVLGHSIGNTSNTLNKLILSFHMPAFFFLSGMCFIPDGYDSTKILKRKCRGLVWPYMTFSIVGVALYWLLQAGINKDLGVNFVQSVIGVLWPDGIIGKIVTPGFWFVYDLIWVTILFVVFRRCRFVVKLFFPVMLFLFLYGHRADFYLSSEIVRISLGLTFFTIGNLFSRYQDFFDLCWINIGGKTFVFVIISIFCLSQAAFMSQSNAPILMYANQYGNVLLFFASSFFGTLGVYYLSKAIDHWKILEFMGRNTLPLLLFHFYALMTTHVMLHKLYPQVENYEFPYNLFHFVIGVVICSLIARSIQRYFPWMMRFKKQKK